MPQNREDTSSRGHQTPLHAGDGLSAASADTLNPRKGTVHTETSLRPPALSPVGPSAPGSPCPASQRSETTGTAAKEWGREGLGKKAKPAEQHEIQRKRWCSSRAWARGGHPDRESVQSKMSTPSSDTAAAVTAAGPATQTHRTGARRERHSGCAPGQLPPSGEDHGLPTATLPPAALGFRGSAVGSVALGVGWPPSLNAAH